MISIYIYGIKCSQRRTILDTANDFLIYLDGFLGSAVWFRSFTSINGIIFLLSRFPQIRYFRHAISATASLTKKAKGETHLSSTLLSLALYCTISGV